MAALLRERAEQVREQADKDIAQYLARQLDRALDEILALQAENNKLTKKCRELGFRLHEAMCRLEPSESGRN